MTTWNSRINCEVELNSSWKEDFALIEHHNNITCVDFKIKITKSYFPVVILFIKNNIEHLENIKWRFKRTVSWNMYRSEVTTQPKNSNIDPKVIKI